DGRQGEIELQLVHVVERGDDIPRLHKGANREPADAQHAVERRRQRAVGDARLDRLDLLLRYFDQRLPLVIVALRRGFVLQQRLDTRKFAFMLLQPCAGYAELRLLLALFQPRDDITLLDRLPVGEIDLADGLRRAGGDGDR